jgi:hypothetical protein
MKRLNLWKAKLKAAKAELRIRERELNAAHRSHFRTKKLIITLEGKINAHMAKSQY